RLSLAFMKKKPAQEIDRVYLNSGRSNPRARLDHLRWIDLASNDRLKPCARLGLERLQKHAVAATRFQHPLGCDTIHPVPQKLCNIHIGVKASPEPLRRLELNEIH